MRPASKSVGLDDASALKARSGEGEDKFERALAFFAKEIVRECGHISDKELVRARNAAIDDGLVMEIVANLALNTFTNYANEVADTAIDFPVVEVKL
jgi:hypothetical protein